MKILKYLAFSALVALSLTSCDKSTEGLTDILYYPVITLEGGDVLLTVGDEYQEQGFSAALGDQDLTGQVKVSSNVDTSAPGFYKVTYSVADAEGHEANESRKVFVNNPGHFDNIYWGECKHKTNAARHYYNSPISIKDMGDGYYLLSDLLCGFYTYGVYPGYPYDFDAESIIQLNDDNTVELIEEGEFYFYDPKDPEQMYDGVFDPATGIFTYRLNYYIGGGAILTPIDESNFPDGLPIPEE
jgi:hypothetical protein